MLLYDDTIKILSLFFIIPYFVVVVVYSFQSITITG